MWARVLLLGTLLSFVADLDAAGDDGGQKSQTPLNNNCDLPQDKGPCDNLELRWFHNSKSKRCERFLYGGCYGNANNYKDINECDRCCVSPGINKPGKCPVIIPSIPICCNKFCSSDASCSGTQRCCATSCGQQCQLPEGDNSGYCPLIIHPPSSRNGNGPLCFTDCNSDQECNVVFPFPLKKCCPLGDRKVCVEAVEEHPGVCPRRVEVFPFVPCNNTCNTDHDCPLTQKCCFTGCSRGCLPSVRNDRCQLPQNKGSCSKELQRFYYDLEEKKCVSFVYRGCQGNSNNFETRELCETVCGEISKEVCKLPKDPGPCLGLSTQYYYNWNTKKCETFTYGLCKGNGNRFETKLECQMVCGEFDICQLPSDSGFGDAFRFRFFYNTVSKACESFLYKGSGGNTNNFWDEDTCTQFCARGPQRRCPKPNEVGICIMQCLSDADCSKGYLCCPTGCGLACRRGVEEER